jgi:hypothetical protein
MNFYQPNQNLDWQNVSMSAAGGTTVDVASIALIHLRHNSRPTQLAFPNILMDLKMLRYLSLNISIRHAILSQHSAMEVTKIAVLSSSQLCESGGIVTCLSACFDYVLWQLSFWTCTIQSLDPQLLRAILTSESHQLPFKKQEILLDLLDTISINLTT